MRSTSRSKCSRSLASVRAPDGDSSRTSTAWSNASRARSRWPALNSRSPSSKCRCEVSMSAEIGSMAAGVGAGLAGALDGRWRGGSRRLRLRLRVTATGGDDPEPGDNRGRQPGSRHAGCSSRKFVTGTATACKSGAPFSSPPTTHDRALHAAIQDLERPRWCRRPERLKKPGSLAHREAVSHSQIAGGVSIASAEWTGQPWIDSGDTKCARSAVY